MSSPLVSVVTPFHNTAAYLVQCIESVLTQTYSQFEYVLVDNCSTDGSSEIVETYARRDPRIRLVRRSVLVSQVENYNLALAEISDASEYCKIVQADDFLFPECLRLMVDVFEKSKSIGLVSAYDLKGHTVRGSGFSNDTQILSGREVVRLLLRTELFVFGSPTTVMYRSSLVRNQRPFFDESLLHEDTEKCIQILADWDFGFVHQVLTYLRVGNQSISTTVRDLQPYSLDRYIIVQRYANKFLELGEAESLKQKSRRTYYRVLAREAIRLQGSPFWHYHGRGLRTLGEELNWFLLAFYILRELLWLAVNPGTTILHALRSWKQRNGRKVAGSLRKV